MISRLISMQCQKRCANGSIFYVDYQFTLAGTRRKEISQGQTMRIHRFARMGEIDEADSRHSDMIA